MTLEELLSEYLLTGDRESFNAALSTLYPRPTHLEIWTVYYAIRLENLTA